MDYREEAEEDFGDPVLDFQIDLDKINAITPDDINPYIPFADLDIDVGEIDMGEYGDDIAYKGGSKDFDFTGGGLGNISLPVKGGKKPPMPPSIGRPEAPILGGSDYMPKPPKDLMPAAPKPKPKPKPRRKPKDMIFAGARPKSRRTVRMGRGR